MDGRITNNELFNFVVDSARTKLIIDLRVDLKSYEDVSIRTSIHMQVDHSEPMERWTFDLLNSNAIKCTKYHWNEMECELKETRDFVMRGLMFHYVIIVDEDGDSAVANRIRELLIQEGKLDPQHIMHLQGGVENFRSDYPYLCSSKSNRTKALEGSLPSEIIPNYLYLGSYENATNEEQLNFLGITHILNMGDELENKFPGKFIYMKCGLDDTSANNIAQFFDRALEFIKNSNSKVLVHCAMGISRSSAIAIAFLMKKNGWPFEKARDYVRLQRSSIKPNDGFIAQLQSWQETVIS
eukprot:TRINITY_DN386_c0_g1_i1.p2 TRINITY_DN386_c0_g1~~TRINITY_DN386_c0_g1_i1.p2  ORF type:complete len:297 (-),score=74.67 TRINITY_DN386_c0_g1_i1:1292-2182(-)